MEPFKNWIELKEWMHVTKPSGNYSFVGLDPFIRSWGGIGTVVMGDNGIAITVLPVGGYIREVIMQRKEITRG